ncbi:hypothetical protein [Halocola ammonii]
MKISAKGLSYAFLISFLFLLIACGKDGEDGSAYINYSWDIYVDSYSDDNPDTPEKIFLDQEYRVSPGTYNFDYQCSDGLGNYWEYSGTYKISIVKGKEGEGFKDGADGRDRLYEMTLTGTGYFSSYGPRSADSVKEKITKLEPSNLPENAIRRPVGREQTEVYQNGKIEVVVTAQCYEIITK